MEKKKSTIKQVVALILAFVIFIFAYSHISSYLLSKEVDKAVANIPLMNMDIYEVPDYLEGLGYTVSFEEKQSLEYPEEIVVTVTANQNEESIFIESNLLIKTIKYEFELTNTEITPFIEDIQWGDNLSTLKRKLSLNFFNTKYDSRRLGFLSAYITSYDQGIVLTRPNYGKCSYDIETMESKEFYKLSLIVKGNN